MKRLQKPRRSLVLLVMAILILLPVYARPSITAPGLTYAYLFVVDVTQSMNVRDQSADDPSVSRLDAAKSAVVAGMRQLPCGSRASLALFAGSEALVLFEPLEVCEHFPAMEKVIRGIDWRMAWTGNSQIDNGIIAGMAEARQRQMNLVFITDGDEAPQHDELRLHNLQVVRESARGLLVGVGGEQQRPIPKLDADNQIIGWWQPEDAVRNGFHPNLAVVLDGLEQSGNASQMANTDRPQEHLSAMHGDDLQQMARAAGLGYLRLVDDRGFAEAVDQPALGTFDRAQRDLRIVFGLLSGLFLLAAFLLPDS